MPESGSKAVHLPESGSKAMWPFHCSKGLLGLWFMIGIAVMPRHALEVRQDRFSSSMPGHPSEVRQDRFSKVGAQNQRNI